jgi:hypothetical protein
MPGRGRLESADGRLGRTRTGEARGKVPTTCEGGT